MTILLLAPHPFYQERGTPIAVDLLLRALSGMRHQVDVLTYHEGATREYEGVAVHRIPAIPFVRGVRPGFSARKVICDLFLMRAAIRMARSKSYDCVHAVEESVFIAMLIERRFGIPYIYDMDSSIPNQIVEKSALFRPLLGLMRKCERAAIRRAEAVAAVCADLVRIARESGAKRVMELNDISLLGIHPTASRKTGSKETAGHGTTFMYIGNLEKYQGIDLLLDSFALARKRGGDIDLTIAGGTARHIALYRKKAHSLGIGSDVRFIGPKPLAEMAQLFDQADVLVSPRVTGTNTPMKIYSYLDSGKPVLATDLPTHTQALNNETAILAPPRPDAFADRMLRIAGDRDLAANLARAAAELARRRYSFEVFETGVRDLYASLRPHASRQTG